MLLNGHGLRRWPACFILAIWLTAVALASGELDLSEFTTVLPHGVTVSRLDTARGPWGNVVSMKYSPDGEKLVFVGDFQVDGMLQYYEAPSDGSSAPVTIPGPIYHRKGRPPASDQYKFSVDGRYLVFGYDDYLFSRTLQGPTETYPLGEYNPAFSLCGERNSALFWNWTFWEVPLDGSAEPRPLAQVPEYQVRDAWTISPDCRWLVYLRYTQRMQAITLVDGLRSWTIYEGNRETERLSKPQITSDSAHVVFSTPEPDGVSTVDVYSNQIDGSGIRVHLFGSGSVTNHEVRQWQLSNDSVFILGDNSYLAPVDGSSSGWRIADDVAWAEFAPVGDRLVYLDGEGLRSVNPNSQVTTRWDGIAGIASAVFTPDGGRFAYVAERDEGTSALYVVTLDHNTAPLEIAILAADTIAEVEQNRIRISQDNLLAFYFDQSNDGRVQLWAVPLDGSSAPWLISDAIEEDGSVSTSIDAVAMDSSGSGIAYLARKTPEDTWRLFSRNVNKNSRSVQISESGEVLRSGLSSYEVTADGENVVYSAYQITGNPWIPEEYSKSLSSVATDGKSVPITLSTIGHQDFETSPCGKRIALGSASYSGSVVTASVYEVDIKNPHAEPPISEVTFYSDVLGLIDVRMSGIRFNADGGVISYSLGEYYEDCFSDFDSCSAALAESSTYLVGNDGLTRELWNDPVSPRFSGNGRYIGFVSNHTVYAANVTPEYSPPRIVVDGVGSVGFGNDATICTKNGGLYSALLSGDVEPIRIDRSAPGEVVSGFKLANDGVHLTYRSANNLFWASIDETEEPFSITSETGDSLSPIESYLISPDGRWVVITIGRYRQDEHKIYSVSTRGGEEARLLSPAAPGGEPGFFEIQYIEISPDSRHIAYVVKTDFLDSGDLYCAAIDGSRPPVLVINDQTTFREYQFDEDGALLAFSTLKDANYPPLYSLHCMASEGSDLLHMTIPERAVPPGSALNWASGGLLHEYHEDPPELSGVSGLYITHVSMISGTWRLAEHQASSTNTFPVRFRLTFPEAIHGLDAGDLANYGSASGVVFEVQPLSDHTWEVRVINAQSDGDLQPGLPALRVQGQGDLYNDRAIANEAVVLDRHPPIVTIQGPDELFLDCGAAFTAPDAVAVDPGHGSLPFMVDDSQLNLEKPGKYGVIYSATDDAGNTGTAVVTVVVLEDAMPPALFLEGANPIAIDCGSVFTDPGATAVDACAGELTVAVDGSVDTSSAGNYLLTYTADDGNGNIATATREVVIADTVAPVLTLAGDAFIRMRCGETFTDPGATALDACAGAVDVTVAGAVDTAQAGHYLLSYTATDPSGNTASVDRTVEIRCGCLLGNAELLYPRDGSLVNVSGPAASLTFKAAVDCPDDTAVVQFYLDGAPLGMPLTAPPFEEAASNIAASPAGTTHTVTIEATNTAGGVISAASAFSVVQVTAQANGLPDLPLGELLPEDSDSYYGEGAVKDCMRLVGMIAWHGDVSGADPALELVAADGTGVRVAAPRALLDSAERGILFVALGCDTADSALDQGAELLDIQPGESNGAFVYTTILISTDAGVSYAEIDAERLGAQPLRYSYAPAEKRALQSMVYTHPAATLFDPMALTGETGTWQPQPTTSGEVIQAAITTPGLSGLFQVDPLGPQIQVTPDPSYPYLAGIVPLGEAVDVPIEVTNIGTGILEGTVTIEGSAAFALIGETYYRLGPGEKLDPGTLTLRFAPATAGDHSATIRFTPTGDCALCIATLTAQGTASATTPESYFNCSGGGRGASWGDGLLMLGVLVTLAGFSRFRSRSGEI